MARPVDIDSRCTPKSSGIAQPVVAPPALVLPAKPPAAEVTTEVVILAVTDATTVTVTTVEIELASSDVPSTPSDGVVVSASVEVTRSASISAEDAGA